MRVGSVGNRRESAASAGFTLVELLVVVGIIGVLAAIMFPVIMKAKESAKTTQCLSNMKQLGSGLTVYLDEYTSRFPAAASWGSPSYWAEPQHGSQKTIQELLNRYVRNGMRLGGDGLYEKPGVFGCPSDFGVPGDGPINGVPPDKPIWKYAGCSYEYYAGNQVDWVYYDSNRSRRTQIKAWTALAPEISGAAGIERIGAPLTHVVSQTRKAVLGDTWCWHMGDQIPDGRLAYRNTLFADGHADRVSGTYHEEARLQPLRPWHTLTEVDEY